MTLQRGCNVLQVAASDALSPDQRYRAFRRFQAQSHMYAGPLDHYTNTVEDAARFVQNNPEPSWYQDYDVDYGDYSGDY